MKIKDLFVTYEIALKLKELGLKSLGLAHYYTLNGKEYKFVQNIEPLDDAYDLIPNWAFGTYTYDEAFKLILNKYNLYGIVIPTITMNWTFKTMTVVQDMVEVPPYNHVDANDYSTYEQAREMLLIKLIELCKQNLK